MKAYTAYSFVSATSGYELFFDFFDQLSELIHIERHTILSFEERFSADIIFIDKTNARQYCKILTEIKNANNNFFPIILLDSDERDEKSTMPSCVDDVISKIFSPSEWKKRLETYLKLFEKEKKYTTQEKDEFKTLFTESQSVMLLIDPDTGQIVNANRAACQFYGYSHKVLTNMMIQDINILKAEQIKTEITNANSGKKNKFVFRHRLANGNIRTVEVFSSKITMASRALLYSIVYDITEKIKTEQQLSESIENYQKVIENIPDIVVLIDTKGIIRFVNERIKEYGNYNKEEIIGKPITDFIPEEDHQKAEEAIIRVFNKRLKAASFISSLVLKDGRRIPVTTKGILIKLGGETLNMTVIRDISLIKEAENKLKESKETFENIFNNASVAIFIQDRNGIFQDVNKAAIKLYGYTDKNELIGKNPNIVSAHGKNNLAKVHKSIQNAFKGEPQQFEFWGKKPNGTVFPHLITLEKGIYYGTKVVFAFAIDISKLKKTEVLLKESEENYRILFEKSPFGIFTLNTDGTILNANPILLKILGSPSLEETRKINVLSFAPLIEAGYVRYFSECLTTGKTVQYIAEYTSKWGKYFVAESTFVPLKDKKGEILKVYVILRDVTEQHKAEQLLKESEEKYRTIFQTIPDSLAISNLKTGRIVAVNTSFEKIIGYSEKEVLGKKISELDLWIDKKSIHSIRKALYKKGFIKNLEFSFRTNKGEIRAGTTSAKIFTLNGERYLVSHVQDTTDLKKAEENLRKSRQLFEMLTSISPTGIFRTDAKGKTTYVNPKWSEITGVSFEKATSKGWADILPPDERERLLDRWTNNMALQTFSREKLRVLRPDGTVRWVLGHAVPEMNNGKFTGYVGTIADITELVKAEQALRESENKYRSFTETSFDIILTFNLQGIITYVNPVIKKRLGYSPEEIIGKPFSSFVVPEYLDFAKSNFNTGKSGKPVPLYELEIFHKSGRRVPVEVNPSSLHDDKGNIIGRLIVVRDITSRKKAEKELLIRDKALNTAANAIIITNADNTIEWINMAFTKLTGYTKEETLGKYTRELIDSGKQDKNFWLNLYNTLLEGKPWKGEIIDKRKDGTLYTVEEIITPVTNEHGKVEHLIGIMTDISERKAAERELRTAKEAAEEGSRLKSAFLANMNHEIRTPMNAIMGFSELMIEATPEEKDNYAKIVFNSSGQLLNLIDDVIFLSRLQSEKLPVKKTAFYPSEIVNEIFLMFDLPEMKKNLQLQTQLPENAETYVMQADVDKIKQVLTNFTSNALKYTKNGYVKLGFEIQNKNIVFFVEDSGMGIPENEQQHIFETFYRGNRAVSSAIRGTGLGLNIAKELVELMGGTIDVISKPGQGSRFYFNLPYEPVKSSFKEVASNKPATKKWEDMNILIAEDDETNFLYLDVLIRGKMHRIDRAYNGREAVEMIRKNAYDIILMDIKMPVMSGIEATRIIKSSFPDLPVIATTAYATLEEKEKALKSGCDDYLSKPIRKKDLLDIIFRFVSDKK